MNWVTKSLAIYIAIVLIYPAGLRADEYENKALITHKGKQGYFFEGELGDRILLDLAEFKELKFRKIPELELKLELLQYNVELHKEALRYSENFAAKTEDALQQSEELRLEETKHLREQLQSKLSWYQKPATVFIIGFVVGSALVVGLSFGLQEAR